MRRNRGSLTVVALGLALALGVSAGAQDAADRVVLADFEGGANALKRVKTKSGSAELVPASPGESGHAVRWTVSATTALPPHLHLFLTGAPDLSKTRFVQFRIRLDGTRAGPLYLRVESGQEDFVEARIRGVTPEWRTMAFDIDAMQPHGTLNPAAVSVVAFVVQGSTGGSYVIDDIELVAAMPAQAAGRPAPAADAKGKPVRRIVTDFEAEESIELVDPLHATIQRVPAGSNEKGFVLASTAEARGTQSNLRLFGVPSDVREYGTIRFRVRASKAVKEPLVVRLETGVDDYAEAKVPGVPTQWKTVALRLPEMVEFQEFDPRRVQALSFTFFEASDAIVQFDDVEFETSAGGWRSSEPELLSRVFGDARAKKVTKSETPHFVVYADGVAVEDKFTRTLEEEYEFVKKTLSLREVDERLPVYIHQNSALYSDFLVRFAGSPRAVAAESVSRGCPRYFATFFQSPDSPAILHGLCASLFQRASGVFGGSWFQEGVASYVEHAWQHESAAELFAPNLRSGQFVHLAEFLRIPKLIAERDAKGGAGASKNLYLQAGAFHEFLARGPLADKAPTLIASLARSRSTPEEAVARVAAVLGGSIDALEKSWVAWGSDPPKAK